MIEDEKYRFFYVLLIYFMSVDVFISRVRQQNKIISEMFRNMLEIIKNTSEMFFETNVTAFCTLLLTAGIYLYGYAA